MNTLVFFASASVNDPVLIRQDLDIDSNYDFVITSNGTYVTMFKEDNEYKVYASYDDGATWNARTSWTSISVGISNQPITMNIDEDDYIHVVFANPTNYNVTYRRYKESTDTWDRKFVIDPSGGYDLDDATVIVNHNQDVMVIYDRDDASVTDVRYRYWHEDIDTWSSAAEWNSEANIEMAEDVDSSGNFYMLYKKVAGDDQLILSRYNINNDTITTRVAHQATNFGTAGYYDLAIGTDGTIHIVYETDEMHSGDIAINYTRGTWDGGFSDDEEVYFSNGYDSRYPQIALTQSSVELVWHAQDQASSSDWILGKSGCYGSWGDLIFYSTGSTDDNRKPRMQYQRYPTFTRLVSGVIGVYENVTDSALMFFSEGSQIQYDEDLMEDEPFTCPSCPWSEPGPGEWGNVTVTIVRNESAPWQSIDPFSILISSSDGSYTYYNGNASTGLTLPISVLPWGYDIIFYLGADNYRQRVSYYDINPYNDYSFTFYLPPVVAPTHAGTGDDGGNSTTTKLYFTQIINEAGDPISEAKVTIKRYLNYTGNWEVMGNILTGGYGYGSIYLRPNEYYRAYANKSGYVNTSQDWFPDPVYHGLSYPFIIQMVAVSPSFTNETSFEDAILFNGYMNSTGYIFVNYTDSLNHTISTNIEIMENITMDTFHWDNQTGSNNFSFNISTNLSRSYIVELSLVHSDFGSVVISFYVVGPSVLEPLTNVSFFDTLFDANYGTSPGGFGWSNLFGFFIMLGGVFSFGQRNSGVAMIITGGVLLFVNTIIGLSDVGTLVPIIFISLGILVQWSNHRRERVML